MNTKEEIPGVLEYLKCGLSISVENCETEDSLWKSFSVESVVRAADAIIVANQFKGKWHIMEDGRLVRCNGSMESEEFQEVSIFPICSESNSEALQSFGKILRTKKYTKINHLVHLSSPSFLCYIAVDERGFYLPITRKKFCSNKIGTL